MNEIDNLDKQLSDLETKIQNLKLKKADLSQKSKAHEHMIQRYTDKKLYLEDNFEWEMKKSKDKANTIRDEIIDLKTKLFETEKLINTFPDYRELHFEPNKEFLNYIDHQIIVKEKELECPLCLDIACPPIFMCSEQHLICSTCRQRLSNCPECRLEYIGKPRRHRYAEKTAEELESLKVKKDQIKKYYS